MLLLCQYHWLIVIMSHEGASYGTFASEGLYCARNACCSLSLTERWSSSESVWLEAAAAATRDGTCDLT